MEFRAVGNRCAVCIEDLGLPIERDKVLAILTKKGFRVLDVDIIALARACIGKSQHRLNARSSDAPTVVNCSRFMKWLYGQRGIWLPRRAIQQFAFGTVVPRDAIVAGDLIFTSGWNDYYLESVADGVGHVGIATGDNSVVHSKNSTVGVIESSLNEFIPDGTFRGARRYVPHNKNVLTFETPVDREVEIVDDLKWIVLQSLPTRATHT